MELDASDPNTLAISARQRAAAITGARFDIYTPIDPFESEYFFPDEELEVHLDRTLKGKRLGGPIRTRSKAAKQMVAEALGYGRQDSFRRSVPRFPGQDLDVFVQQDNNLQIWNQAVSPERRYVLIRPGSDDIVQRVRVVRGEQLAQWDPTGTLTSKYQAKRITGRSGSLLVSESDTPALLRALRPTRVGAGRLLDVTSSDPPTRGNLMPIAQLFEKLTPLKGVQLEATGAGQDRVRGELLQAYVSDLLGIGEYANFGRWPDIVCQALEVKLQTSPTIDLGLVLPTDDTPARALGPGIRHCDARYLIAYAEALESGEVKIRELVVSTGADFFEEFVQFGGLVQNRKRQIRLPSNLF